MKPEKLSAEDIQLLYHCKLERERLRAEARQLKERALELGKQAEQLSAVHLARKFGVHRQTIRRHISD